MKSWHELTDVFDSDPEMQKTELRKKYENTYLLLKTGRSFQVVFYRGWSQERQQHIFTDTHETHIQINHDTEYQIISKFPDTSVFNYNGDVCVFMRRPARQYRRGLCRDNVQVYRPVVGLYSAINSNITLNHDVVHAALFPEYFHWDEAIELLKAQKAGAVALNSKVFLSLSVTSNPKHLFVWYLDKLVGYIDMDQPDIVIVKNAVFYQELLDMHSIFGDSVKVVLHD